MGISAAVLGAGVLGAGASLGSGALQAGSANNALGYQQNVYNTEQRNLAPYLATGAGALNSLASLYGLQQGGTGANGATVPGANGAGALNAFQQFTQTPAYQFPLQQEQLALSRSLGARGLSGMSGAQLMDSNQLASGYASNAFQGYVNQLAQLAGMGSAAAVNQAGTGTALSGANLGANSMAGTAAGAGLVGAANSTNGALSSLIPALNASAATGSSYDVNPLAAMGGSPSTLQTGMGLASNQFVP